MADRKALDAKLRAKRIKDHVKVLRFLLQSLETQATGELESPQKLAVFFAGYIAMRRMWEVKTNHGRLETGDAEIDQGKSDKHSIIYRIEKEVAHPLGLETSTLFRVANFRYWAEKFLQVCEE